MMNMIKFVQGSHTIENTCKYDRVEIMNGAQIEAPEGKYASFVVGGVGRPFVPGFYTDVIIEIKEYAVESVYPSVPRGKPIPLKTALYVNDGRIIEEKSSMSLIRGGIITERSANDIYIMTGDEDFAGIVIDGKKNYVINRARMAFDGMGHNDFVGMGAGVAAIGSADVIINDSEFSFTSVTRCIIHAGGTSTVTVNNSILINESPQVEMADWSWGIAIRGTNRLTQLCDDATVKYNGCYLRSNGWGVLSVDGSNFAHMFIKNSDIILEGPYSHGYGVFCIGPTDVHLDNCHMNVNGFPLFLRGMMRKGIMEVTNGTEIRGQRFGLHSQGDTGSVVTIKDSSIITAKASLVIKGSSGTVYNIERSKLVPDDGNILQLIDNDDPGLDGHFTDVSIYNKSDKKIPERSVTVPDPYDDITLNITECVLKGNLMNSTTDLVKSASKENPDDLILRGVKAPGELGNDELPENFDLGVIPGMEEMPGAEGEIGAPPFMMPEKPHNLVIKLINSKLEGIISSAKQQYRDGISYIDEMTREELSNVHQIPAPAINNGVMVFIEEKSVWTVTGTCWITRLDIANGGKICAPDGKILKIEIDGKTCVPVPGSYSGEIMLSIM